MLPPIRDLAFRPSTRPGLRSPLTARSTGHYRQADWSERNRPRPFSQLFWIQAGRLEFRHGPHLRTAGEGEVFHYPANKPHDIRIGSGGCDYYWLTWDGEQPGNWLDSIHPERAVAPAGPCPRDLFTELAHRIRLPDLESERLAAELAFRILLRATNRSGIPDMTETPREEALCREVEHRLETHFTDPDFGIERLAEEMHLHRATLFRIYRERRNLAPRDYLKRLRLQRGLELLKDPTLPVAEVARMAGYRDPAYFSRLVRSATGKSPRELGGRGIRQPEPLPTPNSGSLRPRLPEISG
jgi:AraC-like DNA-binding protein